MKDVRLDQAVIEPSIRDRLDTSSIIAGTNRIDLRIASAADRDDMIDTINTVTGERTFLQTSCYCPTPSWERLLAEGLHVADGMLLVAVECGGRIVGFARLHPDGDHAQGRQAGNVGIALLRSYRSMGIGAIILRTLVVCAAELDYGVLTANILESNIRSRRLFARCGFITTNCRSIYLAYKDDHVNELYCEKSVSRREAMQHDAANQQKHDQSQAAAAGDRQTLR